MTCYHSPTPLHTPWHFRPFIIWPQCIFYSSFITPLTVHLSQIITHPTFCPILFCFQFYSLHLKSFLSSIKPYQNSTHTSRIVSSFPDLINVLSSSFDFQQYFGFLLYTVLHYIICLVLSKCSKLKKF